MSNEDRKHVTKHYSKLWRINPAEMMRASATVTDVVDLTVRVLLSVGMYARARQALCDTCGDTQGEAPVKAPSVC